MPLRVVPSPTGLPSKRGPGWGPKMTDIESSRTVQERQVQITAMPRGQRQNSTKSQALEAQRKRKDPRGSKNTLGDSLTGRRKQIVALYKWK